MDYKIPESRFSEAATGTGTGTFKQALNDKYVYFDYSCSLTMSDAEAHGIFAWDRQVKAYRYWWFEDSGSFSEAAGDFIDNDTLDQPKVVPYRRGGEARKGLFLEIQPVKNKNRRRVEQMNKCRPIRTFLGVVAQHAEQIAGNLTRTNMCFYVT